MLKWQEFSSTAIDKDTTSLLAFQLHEWNCEICRLQGGIPMQRRSGGEQHQKSIKGEKNEEEAGGGDKKGAGCALSEGMAVKCTLAERALGGGTLARDKGLVPRGERWGGRGFAT